MKTTTIIKTQLLTIAVLMLGACSVKSTAKSDPFIPQVVKYKYECSAEDGKVGIRDLDGAVNLFKNNEILFNNHRGADLSFFITTQEVTTENPVLMAFAMTSPNETSLEYYTLDLKVDLESGLLVVSEDTYTRTTPTEEWNFITRQQMLVANTCKTL